MDAMLVEQVLLNLLINAAIHGGTRTRAALSVGREGHMASFRVSDDGVGFPREVLPLLFHRAVGGTGDGKGISNFIRAALRSGGYDTLMAYSGREAESMIGSHSPDLILLDLGLPDMDGMDIIRSVREWTDTPIVVVSARMHERDKVAAPCGGGNVRIPRRGRAPGPHS